jgi:5'(3')-deoxyribonucleotidase
MILYLDMDGVIADFFGGLESFYGVDHWKKLPNKEKAITDLKHSNFFDILELFPTSVELVNFVRDLAGDNYGICSSPLRGDHQNSSYHKRVWLTRHGFMPHVQHLIFTGQKENHAVDDLTGTPNILVDDKPTNIARWIEKGGIGIRYQANEDSLNDLKMNLQAVYKD